MYKKLLLVVGLMIFPKVFCENHEENLKIWYTKPATVWNEALPVGNGRLGAMVYGNPVNDTIQLNEETFWSGGPTNNNNLNALAALPTIRNYLFAGNYDAAQELADSEIRSEENQGAKFQTVGNLLMTFQGHNDYSDYYRELDLKRAVFKATYNVGDVTYTREVYATYPDQVIVMHLTASTAGSISFNATMNGDLQLTTNAIDGNTLELTGLSSTHEGVTGQVEFDARTKFIATGGTMSTSDSMVVVSGADEVTAFISIATNFVDYETITDDEVAKCSTYIADVETKDYSDILDDHVADYQEYFNRVSLNLGSYKYTDYPIDTRLENFSQINDLEMVTLLYQFGRYLLISSSRPGGQPANLQGVWNEHESPTWDSKYTININTEMNYWPAEKTSLTEMHEPLVQMLKELSVTGAKTASDMYGANGWVTHHNTDLWRTCGVVDHAKYGMWPLGSAWLSQHLWEKYIYSGDSAFLSEVYPVLRDACEFYLDFLVEEPDSNWLVVAPSMSPENSPSSQNGRVFYGTTMDTQLLFDLFTKTIKATKILDIDSALAVEIKETLDQLPPMKIGKWGQLQEWFKDWDSKTDDHRHVSHLYGLYPSNQISPIYSPELFDAARTSLIYRGDVSAGWSMGWKINLWARLLDGDHAYKLITDQLTYVEPDMNSTSGDGGTYPNMFDAHPPFQIDGNFGCTSGITEMLLQTHDGFIYLLPALPQDWEIGEISGIRAYGGFTFDLSWKDSTLERVTIKSNLGGNCRIRVPNELGLEEGELLSVASGDNPNAFFDVPTVKNPLISSSADLDTVILKDTYTYDLATEAGETYVLIPLKAPVFSSATVTDNNPKQVLVSLSELIDIQDTYSGLSVEVDASPVTIDSVVYVDTTNQLAVYMNQAATNENEITLSYSAGNILSRFKKELVEFSDTLVDNLLEGSSPRVIKLATNETGDSLIATFNKKMLLADTVYDLNLNIEYDAGDVISLSSPTYYSEDSTKLSFPLARRVYADYELSLTYSDTNLVSVDNGKLKSFTDFPVENYSTGLPLTFSAAVDTNGKYIQLYLDKELLIAIGLDSAFYVEINEQEVAVKKISVSEQEILIYTTERIEIGDAVTISYEPGEIKAIDKGELEAFTYAIVSNTSKYTALKEVEANMPVSLKCYPNPVKGLLMVEMENDKIETIEVFNTTGQMIYTAQPSDISHSVDCSAFPNGIYFIRATNTRNEGFFERVIVE